MSEKLLFCVESIHSHFRTATFSISAVSGVSAVTGISFCLESKSMTSDHEALGATLTPVATATGVGEE